MSKRVPTFLAILALMLLVSWVGPSARQATSVGQGPAMSSIGPLTFGPDGTLFAADNSGAAIFSLDLGAQAEGGVPGAKAIDGLDTTLAGLLGTGAREIQITDLAVHPKTKNAYVSVMRGQGAGATRRSSASTAPARFRWSR